MFKWRVSHTCTSLARKYSLTVQQLRFIFKTIKHYDATQLEELDGDETKGKCLLIIIFFISAEIFLLPKCGINILRLSHFTSCIFQSYLSTKRLFNLMPVFSSQNVFFFCYRKYMVIVVMQDSYLYCNPQSPVSAEIMCLKSIDLL